MGKIITILAMIGAFVGGTIVAGTAVDAAQGDDKGKPFQELLANLVVDWGQITGMPDDFADGVDDVGITEETDPVFGSSAASSITQTDIDNWNDDQVDDADNDPTNELQTLSGSGEVTLSNGGGSVACAAITGGDGLCDGTDDDTQYDGTDFATSGQSCPAGQVVTGIDANGNLICQLSGPTCQPVPEVCFDGIDNDCDGLVDLEEENCQCLQQCESDRVACAFAGILSFICDTNYNNCVSQCQ